MDADSLMAKHAAAQGWTEATQLILALRYIENQGANDAFEDFLREQDDEDAAAPSTGPDCECDNCGHVCRASELKEIKHLNQRLDYPLGDPRCVEPAGECPVCGCLSYEQGNQKGED